MTEAREERPALVRTTSYPDGRDEIVTVDADRLLETLANTPAVRDIHAGTISSYRVDTSVLELENLVSLLRVAGANAENVEDWPDDVTGDWVEGDEELVENFDGLTWLPRWVEVNDRRVSVVRVDDGALVPVLLDPDITRLEVVSLLAVRDWSTGGGGRLMASDGGNSVGLLRNGVLYEHQWGDFGTEHAVATVGSTSQELGIAVAEWIARTELDQPAALSLEPIDPHSTLSTDDRRSLRAALDACGIVLTIQNEVAVVAREHLVHNEYYRRTRDALAQPKSADGEALCALIRAVAEGEDAIGSLTFATWTS